MSNSVIDAVNALTLVERTGGYEKAFLMMTDSLVEALKGDTLRGLSNLGTHHTPFWGLNLRGPQLDYKISFPHASEDDVGPLQLILHESGVPFWVFAVRSVLKRHWFDFCRQAVIAGDEGLVSRDVEGKICSPAHRANVINVADVQRLLTCLPSVIDTHLQIINEERGLASDAEKFAKRITDKLKGDK